VRPVSIAPSVLPADFARLGEECAALEAAGVDRIQWDVMDGVFVPNLTVGPDVVAAVEHVLDLVDLVLVMTVNPGFGGQAYLSSMEAKIAEVRALADRRGLDLDVEVDGGIGPDTVAGAAGAGANVLVAGSALYRDPEGLGHAVKELRSRAEAALGLGDGTG